MTATSPSGYSEDVDHDGIPDECEGGGIGDGPMMGGGDTDGPPGNTGWTADGSPSPQPSPSEGEGAEAAWEAFYEWSAAQCWGIDCLLTPREQFEAYVDELTELGLPVEGPQSPP
jgi:hypothetical protein